MRSRPPPKSIVSLPWLPDPLLRESGHQVLTPRRLNRSRTVVDRWGLACLGLPLALISLRLLLAARGRPRTLLYLIQVGETNRRPGASAAKAGGTTKIREHDEMSMTNKGIQEPAVVYRVS